jgi:hypothetical protein
MSNISGFKARAAQEALATRGASGANDRGFIASHRPVSARRKFNKTPRRIAC